MVSRVFDADEDDGGVEDERKSKAVLLMVEAKAVGVAGPSRKEEELKEGPTPSPSSGTPPVCLLTGVSPHGMRAEHTSSSSSSSFARS